MNQIILQKDEKMSLKSQFVGNIEKEQNDQHDAIGDSDFNVQVFQVKFFGFRIFHIYKFFLNIYATAREIIPKPIFTRNPLHFSLSLFEPKGIMKAAASQPADRFTNRSEMMESQAGSNFINTSNLARERFGVN